MSSMATQVGNKQCKAFKDNKHFVYFIMETQIVANLPIALALKHDNLNSRFIKASPHHSCSGYYLCFSCSNSIHNNH